MKLKKWLLGLVTFAAMAVLCAVCTGAETYGDFQYSVLDDGTVEITKYIGSAEKVDVPAEIDGKSVTSIGFDAFSGCTSLSTINVATGNKNYVSVNGVLYNKDKTAIIRYPAGKKDKNYTIPGSVTSIGSWAFSSCTSLTSITIPNSVTSIGNCAFYYCKNLTSITIPDSVISIGDGAFEYCTNLTSTVIPNGVTSIGRLAFYDCTSLKTVTIPASVTNIGDNAIGYYEDRSDWIAWKTKKIAGFEIKYNKNTYGHWYATKNGFADESCSFTNELDDGTLAIKYAGHDKTYVIPAEINGRRVTKIDDGAFRDCKNLESITIPNSVTSIGWSAFSGCRSLKSVAIPKSVTEIGSYAFEDCSSLTSIIIPDGMTSISEHAFDGCESLTSVKIPDNVTSIGDLSFYWCTSLKNVTIPNKVKSIGICAFGDCTSLTNITIPKSVTNIEPDAFGYYYCYTDWCDKLDNFKIYCYSGTAGEQYAKDNGFKYELLDKLSLEPVTGAKLGGRAADALRINWTKNASADGYIVEMYQGNKWARVGKITNNSITTFRKSGLKAGTVYNFRVRAYKMNGSVALYSDYSATVTARTNPSVMTGAKLSGRAADALRINWTKNASADGYIVEMYQGNKWVRVAKITSGNTTTFRKAGLKASTVYKFRVRAYKMSSNTALYGNYSATVTARTNPSVMKGVKIGGKSKDALRVNWAKNASAQGYIVEMYKGGKWVRVAKIINNNTTTFRKAGLAKNTVYKFRVRAYHMSGKTALYGNYGNVSGRTLVR